MADIRLRYYLLGSKNCIVALRFSKKYNYRT
jgi:hypothetical protein